jgi:hypothetical protein
MKAERPAGDAEMIQEILYATKYIFGRDVAGRSLHVFPDDTFIVSYPRSGNTWARFLVANLMYPERTVNFGSIERIIPHIHVRSKKYLKSLARPRVLNSHEYFDPRYRKVLYIVRDPRDVVLSSYHFHRKQRQIEDSYPLEDYVRRFVTSNGVWESYASWGQNVASWLATRRPYPSAAPEERGPHTFGSRAEDAPSWPQARRSASALLLVRYEDMLRHPVRELAKVATFLGIEATPERLSQAVERSSKKEMQKSEQADGSRWVLTRNTRSDIPFVRMAESGGWKSALPPASVAEIEWAWGRLMRELGYELQVYRDSEPGSSLVGALQPYEPS